MKKITAICLICTMILSQYGRFLAYVQCTISGLVQGTPCDCEKQNTADYRGDARDLPPPKGMNVAFEEYYLPAIPWALRTPPEVRKSKKAGATAPYAFKKRSDIFRPPRA